MPEQDRFAQIGAMRQVERETVLQEIGPPKLPKRIMPSLKVGNTHRFTPRKRLTIGKDVESAIDAERRKMAPYLKTLAPSLPGFRQHQDLRAFDWRLKTEQDDAEFAAVERGDGAWDKVTIPHYGPPPDAPPPFTARSLPSTNPCWRRVHFGYGSREPTISPECMSTAVASVNRSSLILADAWPAKDVDQRRLLARVAAGATLVLNELKPGTHSILTDTLEIKPCGFTTLDFAFRATGHVLVADFAPDDFRYWHDPACNLITPLLPATFQAPRWTPILVRGEAGWGATPRPALAAAEKSHGKGRIIVSLISLAGRTTTNPAARHFAQRLLNHTMCK